MSFSARQFLFLLTAAITLFIGAAPRALASKLPALLVKISEGSTVGACESVVAELKQQISSRGRYKLEANKSPHQLLINCKASPESTDLELSWSYRADGQTSIAATVKKSIPGKSASSPIVFQTVSELFQALPWDGEVVAIDQSKQTATINVGAVNNVMIGDCLPIEIGALSIKGDNISFSPYATGLLINVSDLTSSVELIKPKSNPPKSMAFRFTTDSDKNPALRRQISKCRKEKGTEASRTISNFLGKKFSSDDIEITGITQSIGFYIISLEGDHDVRAPTMIALNFTNRLQIGEYFTGQVRGFKDVSVKPYVQDIRDTPVTPVVAVAEGSLSFSLDFNPVTVSLGPAMLMDKVNVPYVGDPTIGADGSISEGAYGERQVKTRLGMALGAFGFYEDLLAQFNTSFSSSKGKRFLSVETTLDYRVFKTWLVGGGYRYINLSATDAGEPWVKINALDMHIGFALDR